MTAKIWLRPGDLGFNGTLELYVTVGREVIEHPTLDERRHLTQVLRNLGALAKELERDHPRERTSFSSESWLQLGYTILRERMKQAREGNNRLLAEDLQRLTDHYQATFQLPHPFDASQKFHVLKGTGSGQNGPGIPRGNHNLYMI